MKQNLVTINEQLDAIERCQKDPRFFKEIYFPDVDLWSKQWEVIDNLVKYNRVVVKSGFGLGKTFIAAFSIWWFYCSFPESLCQFTAPDFQLVEQVTWAEVKSLYSKMKPASGFDVYEEPVVKDRQDNKHRIQGITFKKQTAGSEALAGLFRGRHRENMLIVIDEASSVPDEVVEGAYAQCTQSNNKILAISNPTSPTGIFKKLFETDGPDKPNGWAKVTISSGDNLNLSSNKIVYPYLPTKQWLEDYEARWGKDSPQYRCFVNAEFPEQSEKSLISLSQIEAACRRRPEDIVDKGIQKVSCLGIDPADEGADYVAAYMLLGPIAKCVLFEHKRQSTDSIVAKLDRVIRENKIQRIGIEQGGGFHIAFREGLQRLKHQVELVNFESSPNNPRDYYNRKAETAYSLKQRFEVGNICLDSKDDMLQRELTNLRTDFVTHSGYLVNKLEKKDEMKKRINRSPDKMDALLVAQSLLTQTKFELFTG